MIHDTEASRKVATPESWKILTRDAKSAASAAALVETICSLVLTITPIGELRPAGASNGAAND